MFFSEPTTIIVLFFQTGKKHENMEQSVDNIVFLTDFPTEEELHRLTMSHLHTILLSDDKGLQMADSSFIAHLFTRLSHHK